MTEEASQQVTHDDLDRAAEETPEVETEVVAEEITEESVETVDDLEAKRKDEENAERSRLGRKVKGIEDRFESFEERLNRVLNKLETPREVEVDDDDPIITPENLPRYMQKLEEQKGQQQKEYERKYASSFAKIGSDADESTFNDVWEEMLANHNTIVTGNPDMDARLNYLSAENAILRGAKPKNPVKGKGSNVSVNIPEQMNEKAAKPVKFDAVAEEFMRRQGIDPEKAAAVIRSPAPAHLRTR